MKSKYKIGIVESIPYVVVLAVIGLALWLNALIVQDSITLSQAELLGYGLLTGLIGAEVFSLFWLKVIEVEKRQLQSKIDEKDEKIEELIVEYNILKNRE